ncbi:MAG: DUF2834 domain-containing protein [Desulfobacteraceae bacterium]|nr:MAG: DUF2834 domain-containing protein [Desulfobacteraceae bacterium]
MSRMLIVVALVLLGVLTALAVWQEGITGVFASIFNSYGSAQIYVDLVIALLLVSVWMWHDAKGTGRNAWPWIVATLLVGSFAPLVYLLTRRNTQKI